MLGWCRPGLGPSSSLSASRNRCQQRNTRPISRDLMMWQQPILLLHIYGSCRLLKRHEKSVRSVVPISLARRRQSATRFMRGFLCHPGSTTIDNGQQHLGRQCGFSEQWKRSQRDQSLVPEDSSGRTGQLGQDSSVSPGMDTMPTTLIWFRIGVSANLRHRAIISLLTHTVTSELLSPMIRSIQQRDLSLCMQQVPIG